MFYIKKLNALYEEIKYFIRKNLIRYFKIVFKREYYERIFVTIRKHIFIKNSKSYSS